MAIVIGIAAGIMIASALAITLGFAAVFLLPIIISVAFVSGVACAFAARRSKLPSVGRLGLVAVAAVAWSFAALLPYLCVVGEVKLRVDRPLPPPDAIDVSYRWVPLSGSSTSGPAPGVVMEYSTELTADPVMQSLRKMLPTNMTIKRHVRS